MGICLYLFYPKIESFFVFFPERAFDFTPSDLHLNYEEVYFHTDDGKKLHGWFFPQQGEFPVILFCHGNAGNISHRLDNVQHLLKQNLQVFIFDYRGYGKSSGRPSEKGLYQDGLAAYNHLIEERHLRPGQIVIFGRSLGAAVAIEVGLQKEVRSVIIESAFTSTKDMARTIWLFSLFSYLMPANFDNQKKIAGLDVPKLFIHSEGDEIVPFSMGQKLFETAMAPKYFLPLRGAGHNDTYVVGGDKYFRTIATFAKEGRI
jgi:fermentation-respiration switch protein FrsA (DUF1100 family)